MERFTIAVCCALGLALGSVAITARSGEMSPAKAGDKAAIEALEQGLIAAFNAKDASAIMKYYVPGADLFVFDVTPPRQHLGWDDYKKDWEDAFAAYPGPIKVSISDLAVTVAGPLAYSHSIQSGQLTRKDGTTVRLVARVTDVYRKIHGNWLIVQEHVSVPVDLDSGKADLLSKTSISR
jgi:ketosteroid isomerase-like protein